MYHPAQDRVVDQQFNSSILRTRNRFTTNADGMLLMAGILALDLEKDFEQVL